MYEILSKVKGPVDDDIRREIARYGNLFTESHGYFLGVREGVDPGIDHGNHQFTGDLNDNRINGNHLKPHIPEGGGEGVDGEAQDFQFNQPAD